MNVVSMIKSSVLVLFGAVVWGVLDTIFRLSPLTQVLNATWAIIEAVVSPSPESALSGLGGVSVAAFLVASAAVCLLIALRTLPLVELAAAPKQDAIAAHLDWNVRLLKLTALVCGFLSLVVAGMAGERSTFELPSIISGPLYAVTGSVTLRAVLIVISILSVLAVVLTYVIQHVSRMDADSLVTYGIPLGVGSALAGCAFLVAGPLLSKLMAGPLATSPTFVSTVQRLLIQSVLTPGLLAVTGLTVVLTIPLLIIILLVVLSPFLPANARSAALASNGIFAASIGVGLLGVLPLVVFGGLAASFIIWDVTQHATVLGLEVGRNAPSAHVELIHAAGSVLVGVCAIGLATGGLLAARMVPTVEGVTAVVAIVGAVVGVGIVLAAVRLA